MTISPLRPVSVPCYVTGPAAVPLASQVPNRWSPYFIFIYYRSLLTITKGDAGYVQFLCICQSRNVTLAKWYCCVPVLANGGGSKFGSHAYFVTGGVTVDLTRQTLKG